MALRAAPATALGSGDEDRDGRIALEIAGASFKTHRGHVRDSGRGVGILPGGAPEDRAPQRAGDILDRARLRRTHQATHRQLAAMPPTLAAARASLSPLSM